MRRLVKTIVRFGNIDVFRFRQQFVLLRTNPAHFDFFQRLRDREARALDAAHTATTTMYRALKRRDRVTIEAQIAQLQLLTDLVETVGETQTVLMGGRPQGAPAASPPATSSAAAYLVGSWFLADCHRYLLANPHGHERLHFVSGVKIGTTRTLDRLVEVAIESQSAIHAVADPLAAQRTLVEMDEWGHTVHGLFHSHPGSGPAATRPSSTDLDTHERYERGGYPLVGAIFVRDGYVRFFGNKHQCTVMVYGKGVDHVEENLFKIRALSGEAAHAENARRGHSDGPARALIKIQPGQAR
jgi:proteasome lid subunit RPN8/RPN11